MAKKKKRPKRKAKKTSKSKTRKKREKPEQDGGDELLQRWRSLRRALRQYEGRALNETRNASRVARRCEKREFAMLTGDESRGPSGPMQRITIPSDMATIVDVLREARPILEWLRVRNAPLHDSLCADLDNLAVLDKKFLYDEAYRKAGELCFAFGNAVRETWQAQSPAGAGGEPDAAATVKRKTGDQIKRPSKEAIEEEGGKDKYSDECHRPEDLDGVPVVRGTLDQLAKWCGGPTNGRRFKETFLDGQKIPFRRISRECWEIRKVDAPDKK